MPLQLDALDPLDPLDALVNLSDLTFTARPSAPGAVQANGVPILLPVADIEEDPAQPRKEFDDDKLCELAETIRARGVLQAISVRVHPSRPQRWMLNFGARRLRASVLAGKTDIPAFIDDRPDSYDQVIENEQRENLTPLDLALFVKQRLAQGESQAEIARRVGKSKQYITYATALIDAPDWLMQAYRDGRCRGMLELHGLRRLYAEHPREVETWASDGEAITRSRIEGLRQELARGVSGGVEAAPSLGSTRETAGSQEAKASKPVANSTSSRARLAGTTGQVCLLAELDGQTVAITVDAAPPKVGQVLVRRDPTTMAEPVDAARLKLLGFYPWSNGTG